MGSLNIDGSRITSVNKIGRNNGGHIVFSQNGSELSSIKNPSAVENSLNLATESVTGLSDSSINLGGRLKLVDENGIGITITEGGIADLTNPNVIPSGQVVSVSDGPIDMVIVAATGTQSLLGSFATNEILWASKLRDNLNISTVGPGGVSKACTFNASGIWGADTTMRFNPDALGYHIGSIRLYDSTDTLKWLVLNESISDNTSNPVYLNIYGTFSVASGDYIKCIVALDGNGASVDAVGSSPPFTHLTLTRKGI